jgi:integrase
MTASRKQLPRRPLFPGHKPPRGLHGEITQHGKEVWYFREGHGPRTRILGDFASPQFIEAYHRAKYGRPAGDTTMPAQRKVLSPKDTNSLLWLIEKYLSSPAFAAKKPNTQKQHRFILSVIARKNGDKPFRALDWSNIKAIRDHIAAYGSNPAKPAPAPAMANKFISILGILFDWAIEEERLLPEGANPCQGVKRVVYEQETNHPWTDAECDAFEAAYPLGTRERLAYALLSMTGQRSSDVVTMGPQHIDQNGVMRIRQQKTGKWITVKVPPSLAAAIAAGPTGEKTFIAKTDGKPLTISAFGQWMRAACDRIGAECCTPHGLRHAAATRALEAGCDVDYLMGVFGFTLQNAARYVQTARLEHAAERGADHLERKRPKLRAVA